VPADCRLLEALGVRVNNATVTGEANALRAASMFASAAINARSVATMSQPLFGWIAQQSCG
jgi:magnesium-transporting ATPase (P-type)